MWKSTSTAMLYSSFSSPHQSCFETIQREIRRNRCFDLNRRARHRVRKRDAASVKSMTRRRIAPVHRIPHERPSARRQVHADLMRSSRYELALHQCTSVLLGDYPVASFAWCPCSGLSHCHPATVDGIVPQRQRDDTFSWPRRSSNNREVLLEDLPGARIPLNAFVCARRQRDQDNARRVFVEPADQSRPRRFMFPQVPEHTVEQRAPCIPVGRMNHHSGRLVQGHQVLVFVQHVERNRFRLRLLA